MKLSIILFLTHFVVFGSLSAQIANEAVITKQVGMAVFAELGGKGYFSVNADFRISDHQRFGIGITSLDYEVARESSPDHKVVYNWPSLSVMYYYLVGDVSSCLELGVGVSTSPFLNESYQSDFHSDHPLSLHGVFGYRYQRKNGLIFRAGFTPFYRPNVWFLPLGGISLGYSW